MCASCSFRCRGRRVKSIVNSRGPSDGQKIFKLHLGFCKRAETGDGTRGGGGGGGRGGGVGRGKPPSV